VQYLRNLRPGGHHICIVGAPDTDAEYLGFDLLFRVTRGQNGQIKFVRITFWDNHGGISRNRCTQTLVILQAQTH